MNKDEKFVELKDSDGTPPPITAIAVSTDAVVKGAPPIVYKRRFFVLLSYILGYFFWNLSGSRHVILSTSYAKYHNVTNEVSYPTLGIDFLSVLSSIIVLFSYFLGAFAVDRYGLTCVTVGNFGLMLSNWIRYVAFTNFGVVLFSVVVSAITGPLVSVTILAISNRWFPEHERAKATAAGSFVGLLGSAAGVAIGPMFKTGPQVVDFTMLSCKPSLVSNATVAAYYNASSYGVKLLCDGAYADAYTQFCCYTPANVELYNLIMALITSVVFVVSLLSVRNLPPTPPAPAGVEKPRTPFIAGGKAVVTNRRVAQLNFADFFVSGPPIVLYTTVARILPKEVKSYDVLMSAAGIGLAIPTCIIVAIYLDRKRTFWTTTFGAYLLATLLWFIASIGYTVGGLGGGGTMIVTGCIATISFVAWQVSGYELKLEWAFKPDMNLEGAVTAFDRIVINLSTLIFVVFIPPERFGALGTMWIGFAILVIGVGIAALIPNKYQYNRLEYERSHGGTAKPRSNSIQIGGLAQPIGSD